VCFAVSVNAESHLEALQDYGVVVYVKVTYCVPVGSKDMLGGRERRREGATVMLLKIWCHVTYISCNLFVKAFR